MPRYFFHVADGQDLPDLQGTMLPGLAAARAEALKYTGTLLREIGEGFWTGEQWTMTVTDEEGLVMFTLMLMAINASSTNASDGGELPYRPARGTDRAT